MAQGLRGCQQSVRNGHFCISHHFLKLQVSHIIRPVRNMGPALEAARFMRNLTPNCDKRGTISPSFEQLGRQTFAQATLHSVKETSAWSKDLRFTSGKMQQPRRQVEMKVASLFGLGRWAWAINSQVQVLLGGQGFTKQSEVRIHGKWYSRSPWKTYRLRGGG